MANAIIAAAAALATSGPPNQCGGSVNATFPTDFGGWGCVGLKRASATHVNDSASCAAACCAQPGCDIYQWCPPNSLCSADWGPACNIGSLGDEGAAGCTPSAGVESRSRAKGEGPRGCRVDEDCNLNGACDPGGSGGCSCNPGWTGVDCGQLALLPAKTGNYTGSLSHGRRPRLVLGYGTLPTASAVGLSSWGGSIVRDPHDGRYHLFAAEITGGCGLDAWARNSAIIHATSSSGPGGPYTRKEEVLPFFAHEPTVVALPGGGGYVMYKIGCADGAVTGSNCTSPPTPGACSACNNGTTTGRCPPVDPSYERTCQDALHADSLDGPWTRHNLTLGFPVWGNQNLGLESVGPVVLDNGTVLTFTRAWHPGNTGGHGGMSSISLVRADRWNGTYEVVNGSMGWTLEDSFMFRDKSGFFHALFHAFSRDAVGGHAFSRDGIRWTQARTPAYTKGFIMDEGGGVLERKVFGRRERPHLLLDDDRTPTHLITGLTGGFLYPQKGEDFSATFVQGINTGK